MQIFEECLDSISVLDVDSRRRRGELVTFARYFTYLDSRFGKSRQSQIRQALVKLELHKDGKQVTLDEWRNFSAQFQNLMQEAGMSEEEGYEKLNEKIGGLRNGIIDKELKEERKAPTAELTLTAVRCGLQWFFGGFLVSGSLWSTVVFWGVSC